MRPSVETQKFERVRRCPDCAEPVALHQSGEGFVSCHLARSRSELAESEQDRAALSLALGGLLEALKSGDPELLEEWRASAQMTLEGVVG